MPVAATGTRTLEEPFCIGSTEIANRVIVAPMAGVSVQAFRRQGRRFGAGLVCSEMVSACGLQHGNERTLGYLRIARDEHPIAVQVFGSDPAALAEAARMSEAAGSELPADFEDKDRQSAGCRLGVASKKGQVTV